ALGALQRLDMRLLVDRQHDGILRRVEVEADNLGGLGDKVRIVALTPGLARRKIDLVRAQEAPDVLIRHIAQLARQQRCRPTAVARRRRLIEQRQDALAGIGSVTRSWSGPRQVVQPGQAVARKTRPPSGSPGPAKCPVRPLSSGSNGPVPRAARW